MRVMTAVTLATGAAVGFLFGLGVDEETKERIASKVRRKIFYALTGEEMPVKNYKHKTANCVHHYSDGDIPKPDFNWIKLKEHLTFDSRKKASDFVEDMIGIASNYKFVAVTDICQYFGIYNDYMWSRYGWEQEEVDQWQIRERIDPSGKKKYTVTVSEPKYILIL